MTGETRLPRCTCHSENQKTFTSEIALHFAGIEGLNGPFVLMYPTVAVCLDCGKAQFIVPERELKVLLTGAPVEGAAVWLGSSKE